MVCYPYRFMRRFTSRGKHEVGRRQSEGEDGTIPGAAHPGSWGKMQEINTSVRED
jgi:hypothetical protein